MTPTQEVLLQRVTCGRHVNNNMVHYTFAFPFHSKEDYCAFVKQWKRAYALITQLIRWKRYGILKVAEPALCYNLPMEDLKRFVPIMGYHTGEGWRICDHVLRHHVKAPLKMAEVMEKWHQVLVTFELSLPKGLFLGSLSEAATRLLCMRRAGKVYANNCWRLEHRLNPGFMPPVTWISAGTKNQVPAMTQ